MHTLRTVPIFPRPSRPVFNLEHDRTLSPDSSKDEDRAYLIGTHIIPWMETIAELETTRGSQAGRQGNKNGEFHGAWWRICEEYFDNNAKYFERDFERWFQMPRSVFEKIMNKVNGKGIFVRSVDGLGKEAIHSLLYVSASQASVWSDCRRTG